MSTQEDNLERIATLFPEFKPELKAGGIAALPHESLRHMIERAYGAWETRGEEPIRFFPADFLSARDDAPYAIPYPASPRWPSLERLLELYDHKHGIMLLAPLHWQLISTLATIRAPYKVPIAFMHGSNIPVAVEIMRETRMRGIIIDQALIEPFLTESKDRYPASNLDWIISITPLGAYTAPQVPEVKGPLLFNEIHFSPGCPVLMQTVKQRGGTCYELNPDFVVEDGPGTAHVTAASPHVLPALRFPLPFGLTRTEADGSYSIFAP